MGKMFFSCADLLLLLVPASVLGVGRFSYDKNDSRGPDNWKSVDDVKDNYWQMFHLMKVDKNECDDGSRQSPVNLKRNTSCKGDHHMLYKYGSCKIDDVDFKIEPWGLEGHYPRHGRGCDAPNLNIADSFHRRAATRFDLKIPSEHTMDGKRYDAEFYVAHVENTEKKNKDNRGNLVAMTSVLFDVDGDKKNEWLEELIDGWEDVAKKEKRRCAGYSDSAPDEAPDESAPANNRYTGCYKDTKRNRMFSYEAQSSDASTDKCAELCKGYRFFARQYKGQCFCGNRDDYDRHGSSSSCDCEGSNVGGYLACVYETASAKRKNRRLKKKDWHLHAPFKKQHYYGYKGSLTMPPCSDSVFWYIMNNKQKISKGQLQRLKDLIAGYRDKSCRLGTYADKNGSVARPLQSSRGRSIFQCTNKDY
eukprot:CAMPEP_0194305688 /NCGR_PEP_ID=MMETSP0171-20130528/3061_1 /TAXON_ID=218684 /ORGANISM="Corethron pennatum, Strain L29A3" /LENGTH=418 /DNA_ID=CAMNT_0039057293 /DNA_START=50 /DNA_END=1306 /DNA_ORIENTATION=+